MKKEEKEVLLKEIKKYKGIIGKAYSFNNVFRPLVLNFKSFNITNRFTSVDTSLMDKLNDSKLSRKILISNEYGVFGNLLYKYRENIEEDIMMAMIKKDLIAFLISSLNYSFKDFYELIPNNISEKLFADKKFIRRLLFNGRFEILEFINDDLKKDFKFLMSLCELKSNMSYYRNTVLEYFSDDIRSNKEMVLEILKVNGMELQYVSDDLKNDKDVVLCAKKVIIWH